MKHLGKIVYFISFPLSFISFIFPIYAASVGADAMDIAYLYSIFSIVSIIMRPMVGNLIDKKGRKSGVLIGVFLYTIVNIFYILAKDIKFLLIARIIQSLAASFLWISIDTLIYDTTDNNSTGKAFGSLNQNMNKGQMVGSVIGFTIFFNNFTENPFQLIFGIFLITSAISIFYTIKHIPNNIEITNQVESSVIKPQNFKLFLIAISIISFVSSFTGPIYLLYVQENITSDLTLITFLFLPASILSMFLPKLFGNFSDKNSREKIVLIGMLLNAILQLFIPLNMTYVGFTVLYTIISLASMFYGPAFSSIIAGFIGNNKRGKLYGVYSFCNLMASSVGYMIGSYIYENIGKDIVFYIQGILLIVITLVIWYFYNKNKSLKTIDVDE